MERAADHYSHHVYDDDDDGAPATYYDGAPAPADYAASAVHYHPAHNDNGRAAYYLCTSDHGCATDDPAACHDLATVIDHSNGAPVIYTSIHIDPADVRATDDFIAAVKQSAADYRNTEYPGYYGRGPGS